MSLTNRRNPLRIESLERRDNPAISLAGGLVTITGDDPGIVNDVVTLDTYNGFVRVTLNATTKDYAAGLVTGILVDAKTGNDVVNVERLFGWTPATVNPGTGTNTVRLSPAAQDLDTVDATVTVNGIGQTGTDVVWAFDKNDTSGMSYRVEADRITPIQQPPVPRPFSGLIYTNVDNVNLSVRSTQSAQVYIDGTASGTTTSVSGGSFGDVVYVGAGNLDALQGAVNVFGNGGLDAVKVVDDAVNYSDTYTLTATATGATLDRIFFGGVTFSNTVERLDLNAQQGNNTFDLRGMPPVTAVAINANGGSDTIVGPDTANTWVLASSNDSKVGNVTFRDAEHLRGGSMADTFEFVPGGHVWSSIDGMDGTDELDYSGLLSGVQVDLGAGTASLTGSVAGIEDVTGTSFADTLRGDAGNNVIVAFGGGDVVHGGAGDDTLNGGAGNDDMDGGDGKDLMDGGVGDDTMIGGLGGDILYGGVGNDWVHGAGGADVLLGQDGADELIGGNGRDILFGGLGADTLTGGAYDDILASGTTTYEFNLDALNAIRAEWNSTHDYWDRVWNLRGVAANSPTYANRLNGNYFLTTNGPTATVIHPAGPEDVMSGGLAMPTDPVTNHDWFFGHAGEYIDREAGEAVNA